jgi:photosystem II stability/assembly factor-like uncharacterized protein
VIYPYIFEAINLNEMKLLSIALTIAIVSAFSTSDIQAQQDQGLDVEAFIGKDHSHAAYDRLMLELSANKELREQPGWKYLARWIEMQSRRMDGAGNPVKMNTYMAELDTYRRWKKESVSGMRANPWSPAGPFAAPAPASDFMFTGTGRINTITFHPTDSNIMWIGGGQGGLWKTTNGAESWFPLGDDLPVMRISDITVNPNNPDEMYICIGDYAYLAFWIETADRKRNTHFGLGVYKSTDGGINWVPTGLTTELLDKDASLMLRTYISSTDDNVVLAAGIKGIFKSDDRGENWSTIMEREIWDIEQVPADPNTLYASTGFINNLGIGKAAIWKSTDFGETWTKLNTGIPEENEAQRIEIAVSPVNTDYVYAVVTDLSGGLFGFYRSTDAGASWTLRTTTPNILHWFSGEASGGQGNYDLAILADPNELDKVYVSGINTWVTEDGGATWNGASYWTGSFGASVHADHHLYAYNPLDEYIYLCHDGGVSRTKEIVPGSWFDANNKPDYTWPTVWEHLNEGLANFSFYRLGISQSQSRNIYAGAQDMGTFHRQDGQWSYLTLGDGMECIIKPGDEDVLYGSSQFGNLFKSVDGGASFFGLGEGDPPWHDESAAWTTPYALGYDDPEKVYVPAANFWLSLDGGFSFDKMGDDLSIYPISAFSVSPADPTALYIGKRLWYGTNQPGQILRLASDGFTWEDITEGTPADSIYISFLETDDENPNLLWATFAGFVSGAKVFESRDGGNTWTNISYNLPNLPANCIIQHDGADNNPLYVGLDRGVYYKNDLMDEWELYAEGLPNVIVSEFEIHKDDQQLYIATFGRGIWMNNLIDQITTSSNEVRFSEISLSVSPNPSKGFILVEANDLNNGAFILEIVDITGKIVYSERVNVENGSLNHSIDLLTPSGLYYLRLYDGTILHVAKVVFVD